MVLFSATTAFAASDYSVVPYADDVIDTAKTLVDVASGGKITATATIGTKVTASSIGFPTFVIQENRDGKWVTVASGSGMVRNTSSRDKTITYTKRSGYSYRVKTTYKAVVDGVAYTAPGYTKPV